MLKSRDASCSRRSTDDCSILHACTFVLDVRASTGMLDVRESSGAIGLVARPGLKISHMRFVIATPDEEASWSEELVFEAESTFALASYKAVSHPLPASPPCTRMCCLFVNYCLLHPSKISFWNSQCSSYIQGWKFSRGKPALSGFLHGPYCFDQQAAWIKFPPNWQIVR